MDVIENLAVLVVLGYCRNIGMAWCGIVLDEPHVHHVTVGLVAKYRLEESMCHDR